jgi:rhodanese-related sulfurtransferase
MPTPIDRHELQRLLAEQQAHLVEVLPAAKYEHAHLPGAINIPLKEFDYGMPGCTALSTLSGVARAKTDR